MGCEKIDLSGGKDTSSEETKNPTSSDETVLVVKTTVRGSDTFRPEGGSSAVADRILAKISAAEQATGKTVVAQIVEKDNLSSDFLRAMRAGEKYADLIQTDAMFLTRHYNAGNLLSLTEAGISPSATGVLKTVDGIAYALRADGWNHPLPTASYLLYYNESIFTDNSFTSPWELLERGQWNWQNFENLCVEIVTANSELRAIATPDAQNPGLVWATLHSAGANYFDKDGNPTLDTQNALNGFSALARLVNSGCTYTVGSYVNNTADATAKLAFINRRTAFYLGNSVEYFDASEDSLSENLGESLRLIGFPALKSGVSGAVFTQEDTFIGIARGANLSLCQAMIPLMFTPEESATSTQSVISSYFQNEDDGHLFFDLLNTADTHSALIMDDKYSLVEELFLRVAGGGSAKEILNNLQSIYEASAKG